LKNRLTIAQSEFLATPNASRCLNVPPPMKPVSRVKAISFILLLAALSLLPEGIRGFAAETEDGEYEAVAE